MSFEAVFESIWKWAGKVIRFGNKMCQAQFYLAIKCTLDLGALWNLQREKRVIHHSHSKVQKSNTAILMFFFQTAFDLECYFKRHWKPVLHRLKSSLSRNQWLNSSQNSAETPADKRKVQILWSIRKLKSLWWNIIIWSKMIFLFSVIHIICYQVNHIHFQR